LDDIIIQKGRLIFVGIHLVLEAYQRDKLPQQAAFMNDRGLPFHIATSPWRETANWNNLILAPQEAPVSNLAMF